MPEEVKTNISKSTFYLTLSLFLIGIIFNGGYTYSDLAKAQKEIDILKSKSEKILVLESKIDNLTAQMTALQLEITKFNTNILEIYRGRQ